MIEFAKRMDNLNGSVIREILKMTMVPNVISFAGGNPSPTSFPQKEVLEITNELLSTRPDEILQYGATEGIRELKEFLIGFLKRRNINIPEADDVLILSGSSQGIDLFTKSFVNPEDYIAVENPTFLGALQTFKSYETNFMPVESDEEGIILDGLKENLLKYKPKFMYIIPTFQNPSGRTLPLERRLKLLEIANETNTLILEDDPYSDLRYYGERVPSLKSLDKFGIVTYLGSFSKIISPGLRVGYAVGRKDILRKMTINKQGADVHTSNLSQHIVCKFGEKYLENHIKCIINEYKEKCDLMVKLLSDIKGIKITRPKGGLFVWASFDDPNVDTSLLLEKAVSKGVAFVPGSPFYADGKGKNTLRLNFSNSSLENIEEGIRRLSSVL